MPLEIGIIRGIKTANQAVDILSQAQAEGKRAVVVQTESGRAIRIMKPNNILTRFLSYLSGQTTRELNRINDFLTFLRKNEIALQDRAVQIVPKGSTGQIAPTDDPKSNKLETIIKKNSEDFAKIDKTENSVPTRVPKTSQVETIIEESAEDLARLGTTEQAALETNPKTTQLEAIVEGSAEELQKLEEEELKAAEAHSAENTSVASTEKSSNHENIGQTDDETKKAHQAEVKRLLAKNAHKLAENKHAEQKHETTREINEANAQEVKRLIKNANARKVADDEAFDARGHFLQSVDRANRELDAMIDQSRKEIDALHTEAINQEKAAYVADMKRALTIVSPATAWKMIPTILASEEQSLATLFETSVKEAVIREQLTTAIEQTQSTGRDIEPMIKLIANRVTQTKGQEAIYDKENPNAFDPYAVISFNTLKERTQEAVDLLMQGKSLDDLPIHKHDGI